MRFQYSHTTFSPEMIVPVVLGAADSPLILDFDGKVDTGADIVVVPSTVRQRFGIPVSTWTDSSGALGQKWTKIPIFYVRLRVAGGEWLNVLATESRRDYVLLGRNVLNQFILTANGPAGWFELDLPRAGV